MVIMVEEFNYKTAIIEYKFINIPLKRQIRLAYRQTKTKILFSYEGKWYTPDELRQQFYKENKIITDVKL